ncbi:MAG: rod-binding protein [Gallionella sp.]
MAVPPNPASQLAIDANSLDRLRAEASKSPDKALKAAAQQFEAVFLNMMLKSMRDATPQDGVLDNQQTKMYTGMLDQQLAQSMANRGIGLADIMVKQLGRTLDVQAGNAKAAATGEASRLPAAQHPAALGKSG